MDEDLSISEALVEGANGSTGTSAGKNFSIDAKANLGDSESVADNGASADPLDQISDLFRDLEESCVVGKGQEVLDELPKAANPQSIAPQDQFVALAAKNRPLVFQKKFWCRVVSLPELIFSVGFSLLLVLITLVISAA